MFFLFLNFYHLNDRIDPLKKILKEYIQRKFFTFLFNNVVSSGRSGHLYNGIGPNDDVECNSFWNRNLFERS